MSETTERSHTAGRLHFEPIDPERPAVHEELGGDLVDERGRILACVWARALISDEVLTSGVPNWQGYLADDGTTYIAEHAENAARLTRCWNACADLTDAEIAGGVLPEPLFAAAVKSAFARHLRYRTALRAALEELRRRVRMERGFASEPATQQLIAEIDAALKPEVQP